MDVLNDTVASLLAGVTATRFSPEYEYIGFILGTGSNTAYVESNRCITKEKGLRANECMAINCESANFNKIKRGDIDLAFDETTASPKKHVLEKMVSGGYLGGLCHLILTTAVKEGVLSPDSGKKLGVLDTSNAKFLSTILSGQLWHQTGFADISANDRETITSIVAETVERAALVTAINMAAPIVKTAKTGLKKKYCISADGSVYYKLFSLKDRVESHLDKILAPYCDDYKVVRIDEAPTIGTAVAGLVD
jgi:hexokinase